VWHTRWESPLYVQPTRATQGSTIVDVVATATPATLAQIEALVKQLL